MGWGLNDVALGEGSTQLTRAALSIWYKDIAKVLVYRMQSFGNPNDGNPAFLISSHYVCQVVMREGPGYLFTGEKETDVKRVASAFATLSGANLEWVLHYNRAGCIVDKKTGEILGFKSEGAFDRAGIPLFSKIDKIDQQSCDDYAEERRLLNGLSQGSHVIEYQTPWDDKKTANVLITDQD